MLKLGALDNRQARMLLTALWCAGFAQFGRCGFDLIESEDRVRLYVAKYIVKGSCDHRFLGCGNDKGLSVSQVRRKRRRNHSTKVQTRRRPAPGAV